MSYLRGKNTLSALEVTLSEIYSLRRSGSNTIPLQDVDEHLSNRPDYIIWRLLRERNAHTSLSLPKGIKGGKELLLSSLTDAANHSDLDVKWTAYSLISLGLLRMASVEEPLRFIRAPSKLTAETIENGDKITNSDLEKILKWMQLRQQKFKKKISTGFPDYPLRSNSKQTLTRNQLLYTEQLLLLAIGEISIYLVSVILGQATNKLANETLQNFNNLLNKANGGWRPGQVVFTQNLQHLHTGYKGNIFSSCYLPFDFLDYNDWIADAVGRLAKTMHPNLISDQFALLLCFTSIQNREWLFSHEKLRNRKNEGNKLMIAIDHGFKYATLARRVVIMGGLAARYLAVGNTLGWKNMDGNTQVRQRRARKFKAIAKIAGCPNKT